MAPALWALLFADRNKILFM